MPGNPQFDLMHDVVGNLVIDRCSNRAKNDPNVFFNESDCSAKQTIRFRTAVSEQLFPRDQGNGGSWGEGIIAIYEIENLTSNLIVSFKINAERLDPSQFAIVKSLMGNQAINGVVSMRNWDLDSLFPGADINQALDGFFDKHLGAFEAELKNAFENASATILEPLNEEELEGIFLEGSEKRVILDKYERNPAARKRCIEIHGTRCAICGMDFGETYGPEFAGKIEVHHIVPISSYGEEHEVDPKKDLIPVCPNCHWALHLKENGVYSPQELKTKIKK